MPRTTLLEGCRRPHRASHYRIRHPAHRPPLSPLPPPIYLARERDRDHEIRRVALYRTVLVIVMGHNDIPQITGTSVDITEESRPTNLV